MTDYPPPPGQGPDQPQGQPPQSPGQSPGQSPYGQTPYGQQPSGQPPYGQAPDSYGQPYGSPQGYGAADPERRPGTVTAAVVITWVLSGLSALLFGFTMLAILVAKDAVIDELERQPGFEDAGIDSDAAVGVIAAVLGGFLVWSLIAFVLAVFVFRRSNAARIALIVSASVAAIVSLLSITSIVSFVTLAGSVTAIVLLFMGGAGDWFARRGSSGEHDASGYDASGYDATRPPDWPNQA